MMRFFLAVLAYVVPTFALGFVWHLVLFERYYAALAIYRSDIIIPFGLLSMLIQSVIFAWVYERAFAQRNATLPSRGLAYGALGAALSWSFTTLAVAAKNVMTSVPDYLIIETAYTAVQWAMVGPLTALAFGRSSRTVGPPGAPKAAG
jgi:ABC-type sugar transport system permease subunit